MSYKPPRRGSAQQDLFLDAQDRMGGQFWPPELEEDEMPEVGAKFPRMLYNAGMEVTVYDEEEYEEAKSNGFHEHPGLKLAEPQKKQPPPEAPVAKQPETKDAVDTKRGQSEDKESKHHEEKGSVGKGGKPDPGTHRK